MVHQKPYTDRETRLVSPVRRRKILRWQEGRVTRQTVNLWPVGKRPFRRQRAAMAVIHGASVA